MYSMENYFWGGVGYVLGVLLLLPFLWRCTRWLPWRPLKALLRIFVLAVLLVPVQPYSDKIFLAPAWAVAVFEYIHPTVMEGAVRGLLPIAAYFLGAYGLYLIGWIWWQRRRPAPQAVPRQVAPNVAPPMASPPPGRKQDPLPPEQRVQSVGVPSRRPLSEWGNRRD